MVEACNEKILWHRCFAVNFAKFLRTPYLQNTSGRLLLSITDSFDLFECSLESRDQIYDSVDKIIDSFRFHHIIKNIKL